MPSITIEYTKQCIFTSIQTPTPFPERGLILLEDLTRVPGRRFAPVPHDRHLTLPELRAALTALGHYHGAWARHLRGHRHVAAWREGEEAAEPASSPADFGLTDADLDVDGMTLQWRNRDETPVVQGPN